MSIKFAGRRRVPDRNLTKLFQNSVPTGGVLPPEKRHYDQFAGMQGIRERLHSIAQGMHAEDKQTLLKIAEAWEMRALELEKREKTLRENDLPKLGLADE